MLKSENRMNNKGFSLVEVIVAIAILALVTAPFLSSFVSATKNNERSQYQIKAKQSGEAVIEAFKGSSMSYLVSEYGLTEKTDATGKGTGVYTTTLTSDDFSGLGTNYTAEVTMTPTESGANSDITAVKNLYKSDVFVLADVFDEYDDMYALNQYGNYIEKINRRVDVTLSKNNNGKYVVNVGVGYYDANKEIFKDDNFLSAYYTKVPKIYTFYSVLSSSSSAIYSDRVTFINKTSEKNDVYFIQQENSRSDINTGNVKFTIYKDSAVYNVDIFAIRELNNYDTTVHTNVRGPDGALLGLTDLASYNYLYDIEVKISRNGESLGTYSSSKADKS